MINTMIIKDVQVLENIGPSRVRALPVGVAEEQIVHYFWSEWSACAALRPCSGRNCLFFFLLCHILFSQKGLSYGSETHGLLCPPIY